jgi:hypothetical protein
VFGGIAAADPTSGDWAGDGITAVRAATDVAIADGVNPLFDGPTQTSLGQAFVQASAVLYVTSVWGAAGITVEGATIPTLLGQAFSALAAGDISTAAPAMVATLMAAPDSMVSGY